MNGAISVVKRTQRAGRFMRGIRRFDDDAAQAAPHAVSTRKVIFLALAVAAMIPVVLLAFHLQMPRSWKRLQPGMSRQTVLATAAGKYSDMLDPKGFDVFSADRLRGSSNWQLFVTYDAAGTLATAEVHFNHRDYGLFNTTLKSIL
jgi:hypothetical protein